MAHMGHLHILTLPNFARCCWVPPLPPPLPRCLPQRAGPPHLHSLHQEQPPSSLSVPAAQGLPVLMPGDVGRGGAPGITAELQGGTGGQ